MVDSSVVTIIEDWKFDSEFAHAELAEFVASQWDSTYGSANVWGRKLTLVTGGWSDNEMLLAALKRTLFWPFCWEYSEVGGLHKFKTPTQRRVESPKRVNRLKQKERTLAMYELYKEGYVMQEIGDKHGITRERVRQLFKAFDLPSRPSGLNPRRHAVTEAKRKIKEKEASERSLKRNRKRLERLEKCAEDYRNGAGFLALAKRYHIGTVDIKDYFDSIDLKSRPMGAWLKENGHTVSKKRKPLTLNGVARPVSAWAKDLGTGPSVIRNRLRAGWSLERALTEKPKRRAKSVLASREDRRKRMDRFLATTT
jgi:hypothetical protein